MGTGGPTSGPVVVLDLDYTDGVFELVLVNTGEEPAIDIGVKFSRKLTGLGGSRVISDLPLWNRLTMLRPGKEIRVFFDTANNVFRPGTQRKFTAKIAWQNYDGRPFQASYTHDFEAYRGMPEIIPPGLPGSSFC